VHDNLIPAGSAKLAGKLPKLWATNGLDAIASAAVDNPDEYTVLVIAELVVNHVKRDIVRIERIPTLQVARIEPLSGLDADLGQQLLTAAQQRRTTGGQQVLHLAADGDIEDNAPGGK